AGEHGSHMQHRGQLNPEFPRRMNSYAELKCFANSRCLHAWTNASPECGVEQNHIDRRIQDVGSELLEIDNDGVRRKWHANHFPCSAHSMKSIDRVLEVVIVQSFDGLAEANGLLCRPHGIWIEPQRIRGKCRGESTVSFQLVIRMKDATFEFVRRESEAF